MLPNLRGSLEAPPPPICYLCKSHILSHNRTSSVLDHQLLLLRGIRSHFPIPLLRVSSDVISLRRLSQTSHMHLPSILLIRVSTILK